MPHTEEGVKVEWGKQIKNKWKQGGDVDLDLIVPVIDIICLL